MVLLFGLVPLCGVMLWGFQPRLLASSTWWSPASPSSTLPWWRQGEGGGSGDSPINKLVVALMQATGQCLLLLPGHRGGGRGCGERSRSGWRSSRGALSDPSFRQGRRSLFCKRRSLSSAVVCSFVLEKGRSRQGDEADGDREFKRRWFCRSYGARRLPVSSDKPSYPTADRRPCFFLPALMPKGEAVLLKSGVHGLQLWRYRRTKWSVPGRRRD